MTDVRRALPAGDASEGMSYLSTLPRRLVTLYLPLSLIVIVLLFPFYWMTVTAVKPKEHLLDLETHNPDNDLTWADPAVMGAQGIRLSCCALCTPPVVW
jgi:hypothetical protein